MAVTRAQKEVQLKSLVEKFSKAKAVYFAEYRGLTVKEVSNLRRKLRSQGIDYVVAKKTLMKIAAKNNNLPELPDAILSGPVAAVFGYDDIVTPSKLVKEAAGTEEKIKLVGGLLEGRIIDQKEAMKLASLPTRQELLSMLVGTLQAPVAKFVRTLDAIKSKQESTVA